MAIALDNWAKFSSMPRMDENEFARWVSLLEQRIGTFIPHKRKTFLVSGVRSRMRETGHTCFDEYYRDLLDGPRGAIEWSTLVHRLMVHETRFFRHQPSFDWIAHEWLPQYLLTLNGCALHAWSVGCASGEEAYSLAMLLDQCVSNENDSTAYFGITATDVSQSALDFARKAIYPDRRLIEIPTQVQKKYCCPLDNKHFSIAETLRKRVGFVRFNLVDMAQRPPLKGLDLIFCQNVLIYFARERRRELLGALLELLNPGGVLVLGAGEITRFSHPKASRTGNRHVLAFLRRA